MSSRRALVDLEGGSLRQFSLGRLSHIPLGAKHRHLAVTMKRRAPSTTLRYTMPCSSHSSRVKDEEADTQDDEASLDESMFCTEVIESDDEGSPQRNEVVGGFVCRSEEQDEELSARERSARLKKDIYKHMQERELRRKQLELPENYVRKRKGLGQWVDTVGTEVGLSPETIQTGLSFVDRIAATKGPAEEQYELLAVVSLIIAAKVVEPLPEVSFLEAINETAGCGFSIKKLIDTEHLALRWLEWELLPITTHQVLRLLLAWEPLTDPDEDRWQGKQISLAVVENVMEFLHGLAGFLADMIMLDEGFVNFSSTLLASACCAIARRISKIEPVWPERWHARTGYSLEDMDHCSERLRNSFTVAYGQTFRAKLQALFEECYGRPATDTGIAWKKRKRGHVGISSAGQRE